MFSNIISDDLALWLIRKVLDRAKVDVSFMNDAEFNDCANFIFNSLEYMNIDENLLTGEKYMGKHLNIGDQLSQVAGIYYPHRLDNYIKIACGERYMGRYMDDFYVIHHDKYHLQELLHNIVVESPKCGIVLNLKKTKIVRINDYWKFLQVKYRVSLSGRIEKKINQKRLTAMRRKLKKMSKILSIDEFNNYYKSWFMNHYKIMSNEQRCNMDNFFYKLKGR